MSEFSDIKIETDAEFPGYTHIFVDGTEIKGIRSFKLEQDGSSPILTLDLNAFQVTVSGHVPLRQKGIENGMKIVFDKEHVLAET